MRIKKYIIISISSDIGVALAESWLINGDEVVGTFRNINSGVEKLKSYKGLQLIALDLMNSTKYPKKVNELLEVSNGWDVLVFSTGTQEPIGNFAEIKFEEWSKGLEINLLRQLEILHRLLPLRNKSSGNETRIPTVLFFAGGGTNNSVVHYSSYTLSKIALIKMCELLDSEIPDTKFSIIGPGWVKTKIHKPTLDDRGVFAGKNFAKTKQMLDGDECVSISSVVNSCNWIIEQDREIVSGRNFSTKNDAWGSKELNKALEKNPEMYKLRRAFNNWQAD